MESLLSLGERLGSREPDSSWPLSLDGLQESSLAGAGDGEPDFLRVSGEAERDFEPEAERDFEPEREGDRDRDGDLEYLRLLLL